MFSLILAIVACGKDEVENSTPSLDASVKQIEIGAEGGTKEVAVNSNINWQVFSNSSDWCSVSPASGSNNGSFNVVIASNETLSAREAKITLKGESLTREITVNQDAASKKELLSGSTWEMISQGSGDDNYNDLIGTIIDLKADMSTVATMNLKIEEGVYLDKIEGVWNIKDDVISVVGDFLGMEAELSFEIKNMTETMMECTMKINMPLLPPSGIPVVLKKVNK